MSNMFYKEIKCSSKSDESVIADHMPAVLFQLSSSRAYYMY